MRGLKRCGWIFTNRSPELSIVDMFPRIEQTWAKYHLNIMGKELWTILANKCRHILSSVQTLRWLSCPKVGEERGGEGYADRAFFLGVWVQKRIVRCVDPQLVDLVQVSFYRLVWLGISARLLMTISSYSYWPIESQKYVIFCRQ